MGGAGCHAPLRDWQPTTESNSCPSDVQSSLIHAALAAAAQQLFLGMPRKALACPNSRTCYDLLSALHGMSSNNCLVALVAAVNPTCA
jgi:CBS-domain-containing membrane protein